MAGDDTFTTQEDTDERFVMFRGGQPIADLIWDPDLAASLGKPTISEGSWVLCREGSDDVVLTRPINRPIGRDELAVAEEQARRLLGA